MHSYDSAVGQDFLLMDENACRTGLVLSISTLSAKRVECMDWPAPSPDVNPIEHVLDILQRWITAQPALPQTWKGLARALI